MLSKLERIKNFAKILSDSRYNSGLSQEYIAAELGVSRQTISKWESGATSPDAFQLTEWFRILNLNPAPYLFDFFNSEVRADNSLNKEEKLEITFERVMQELSTQQKRDILYLLTGTYQGDPYAMLQLFVAHAHLPMQYRFSIANQICETYKLCEQAGMLKDTDYVLPNIEILEKAITAGREAAVKGEHGYYYKDNVKFDNINED